MSGVRRANGDVIEALSGLFTRSAAISYGDGQVSMCAHMLQSGMLAEQADAPPELTVAALLHDVGHFGTDFPEEFGDDHHTLMQEARKDRRHQEAGANLLAPFFGPEVAEPIRLHVSAKRYLCSIEPSYEKLLSKTTRHTLTLQGGPMTKAEVAEFATQDFASDAVQMRRWDDLAVVGEAKTPDFDHFRPLLADFLAR